MVMGPAGSGKSTYCAAIQKHCETHKRYATPPPSHPGLPPLHHPPHRFLTSPPSPSPSLLSTVHVVNLDPAAEHFDYPVAFDIRDLISLPDVMGELSYGPNGGLVYALDYFASHLSFLQTHLDAYTDDYLVFDCIAEGSLISLADGTSLPIEAVCEGTRVLSRRVGVGEGEGDGLVPLPVKRAMNKGVRPCVELLFSDGRTLTCTADHRILTAEGRWVKAGELVVGTSQVAVGVEYPRVDRTWVERGKERKEVKKVKGEGKGGVGRGKEGKEAPFFTARPPVGLEEWEDDDRHEKSKRKGSARGSDDPLDDPLKAEKDEVDKENIQPTGISRGGEEGDPINLSIDEDEKVIEAPSLLEQKSSTRAYEEEEVEEGAEAYDKEPLEEEVVEISAQDFFASAAPPTRKVQRAPAPPASVPKKHPFKRPASVPIGGPSVSLTGDTPIDPFFAVTTTPSAALAFEAKEKGPVNASQVDFLSNAMTVSTPSPVHSAFAPPPVPFTEPVKPKKKPPAPFSQGLPPLPTHTPASDDPFAGLPLAQSPVHAAGAGDQPAVTDFFAASPSSSPKVSPVQGPAKWTLDLRQSLGYVLNMDERVEHSLAFARLLGYALTDGSMWGDDTELYLGHALDADAALFDVHRLTGIRPKLRRQQNGVHRLCVPRILHSAFGAVGLVAGRRSVKVTDLPAFVCSPHCPLPVVQEFLGGLFGGDGHTLNIAHQNGVFQGLGYSLTRGGAVSAQQRRSIEQQLLPLLARAGIDIAADAQLFFSETGPCAQTEEGRQQLEGLQAKGAKVRGMVAEADLKAEGNYELRLSLSADAVVAFAGSIGFRYCCHKAQRLTAALAYYRGQEVWARQRALLNKRILALRASHTIIEGTRIAKREIGQTEQLLPDLAAWKPKQEDQLRRGAKRQGRGVTGLLPQLEEMDSLRFFSSPRPKRNYSSKRRLAELSNSASVPSSTPVDTPKGKVVYGVHHEARSLPLFHVQLVGRRDVGNQRVYDLSVPNPQGEDSESFVANGVVVHNCPGQIELYTHLDTFQIICRYLQREGYSVCALYCIDSLFITDQSRIISGVMMCLSVMTQLELPHINVLTKCDQLQDKSQIDAVCNPDMEEVLGGLRSGGEGVGGGKFARLNEAIAVLIEQYSMVSFIPLDLSDEESIDVLLMHIDNAIGYGEDVEPQEPKDEQEVEVEPGDGE